MKKWIYTFVLALLSTVPALAQIPAACPSILVPPVGNSGWTIADNNFSTLAAMMVGACQATEFDVAKVVTPLVVCTGGGASCLPGGTGLLDPGSNGLLKRIGVNTTAIAANADVIATWTGTCNSTTYLRGDGSCNIPAGAGISFAVGGTPTTSQTTINFQAGGNLAVTNPSAGNVSYAFTGQLANTIGVAAHQWLTSYNAISGNFGQTQPAFADISGILGVASGGTGTATPSLVAGSNVTVTGSWPNQTVSSSAGGGGAFQTNATPLSSTATINFQNSAAFNGLTATFANPSAGNVQLGFTGTLGNAGLTNSSIIVTTAAPLAGAGTISLGGTLALSCPTCLASTLLTTNGDIIAQVTGVPARLAQGANGTFLGVSGGVLGYYTPAGGAPAFNTVTAGTNIAALLVGTGGSFGPTGTGTVTANAASGTAIAQTGVDINTSFQVTATHLSAALPVLQGGTGVTTPSIVAGTNITVTGTWPNQTVNATAGGAGTVTTFSAGTLSPLFTTSVATATSTPALSFTLSTAAANTVLANCTGATAAPTYCSLTGAMLPLISLTAGVSGILPVLNGGTGTATPALVAGTNITITGSWPNQTVNATAGGAGTVTTFSSGNLSPLFTSSVATATSTPAQTFVLSTAAAHTFFGNNTGATASPGYQSIGLADLPTSLVTSTSPGVGIAHFAGSTQAVTSSAVDLSSADATGILAAARFPALTGDATSVAGSLAITVSKINGVSLSGLATGIVKNTTGTGAPSIAVAGDFPTLNQSTTGNATTAGALSGTPVLCSAGNAPLGILANGNATGCAPLGSGGTPGGSTTQLQFNNTTFGGTPNGTYTSGTGLFSFNQLANSNNTVYSTRFTDTTPTGNFLTFKNAAGSTTLFNVDILGNISGNTVSTGAASIVACAGITACIEGVEQGTGGTPTAGRGYIRFDSVTHTARLSVNGGAEASIATGAGGGVTSLTGDSVLISNSASTGAVTLTQRTFAAGTILGNPTGSAATPVATANPVISSVTEGTNPCTLIAGGTGYGFCLFEGTPPLNGSTTGDAIWADSADQRLKMLNHNGTATDIAGLLDFAAPPAIGNTTAAPGAFTTLSASSTVSGTGFSTYLASPPAIGGTAAGTGKFTTLTETSIACGITGTTSCVITGSGSTSGTATLTWPAVSGTTTNAIVSSNNLSAPALVSTVATGTAPLQVTSTTNVPNLNASSLGGATMAAPGAIGGTTPAAGSFTTLTYGVAAGAPSVNKTIGMTTSAMSAQSSATLTAITNMSWSLVASKNYDLSCEIPVTFVASATIAFGLVGPGTPTSYNIDAYGLIGAAAVYGDIGLQGQTTWVSTKTGASGAPGAVTEAIHLNAQIQNGSTAGAMTLDTAANGTNNITVGANAVCRMTQQN